MKDVQYYELFGGIALKNHAFSYKNLNVEVYWLTTEMKRGIWQCEVLEAKGTSEMWQVQKSLTDNKPNNNTRIITDNGRASGKAHIHTKITIVKCNITI